MTDSATESALKVATTPGKNEQSGNASATAAATAMANERDSRTAAHTHIKGLGLDELGRAKKNLSLIHI